MPLPVRQLPVLQNWDCQGCSNCCHEYQIAVTDAERRRILDQGWEGDPQVGGAPLFVRQGPWWSRTYRLNHRPDGACVFLSAEGRCRIHERFGPETKPLACRLYPFVLVPAGDHWRVGLRYACPAAADNQGRPLREHRLDDLAAAFETQSPVEGRSARPPALQRGQRVGWPDFLRFVQAISGVLRNRQTPVEQRLRQCLALAKLCRRAKFDKITGGRLTEFLHVVLTGLEGEVPVDPAALPEPTWVGRVLFRQALALYARKDHGRDRGEAARGRLYLLGAAWRFARGQGRVPRVHAWMPETTFDRVEKPAGPLPEAAELALERYYTLKVESLQFCGPTNFGMPLWEGLDALALTLPIILWLARSRPELPREEAVARAVGMVDYNFGFNRLLGTLRQRYSLSILSQRGELERLIGWYSR